MAKPVDIIQPEEKVEMDHKATIEQSNVDTTMEKESKDENSKSEVSNDEADKTKAGALTTADQDKGSACKTFVAYINGMGWGWYIFAMFLQCLAYGR